MEDIVAKVAQMAGLTTEKAEEVVTLVVAQLKDRVPGFDQLADAAGIAAGAASEVAEELVEKATDLLGNAGGLLGSD